MDVESNQPGQTTGPSNQTDRRFVGLRRAVLLYVVTPYVAVCVLFTCAQRWLMYQPTVSADLSVAACRLDPDRVRDVTLNVDGDIELRGWLLTASGQESDNPLVVYFPGNSLNRDERVTDLREIAAAGYDVLIFDYRGFGDSDGAPSETALAADARRVWDYAVHELGYEEGQTVIFGESLGGAVALSLWNASNEVPDPAALILNSTFTSMPEVVGHNYPWFPFQWLVWDRWPSIERIGRVDGPIVIFHGAADATIPASHAKRLGAAAHSCEVRISANGVHNEIPSTQLSLVLKELLRKMAGRDE